MKASKGNIGRAVDQPGAQIRFYLFHGPDEAQSRALGERLLQSLGASRFVINAGAIKSDPAALADEAGAISMFGDKRLLWIEPAGDEIAAGVEALLQASAAESPAVAIAGGLRKTSAVLKLAEASDEAVAFASYAPEGADAERMVIDVGRRFGLKIGSQLAAMIAESCGNDQAIVSQELQKFALYADASPQSPKELSPDAVEAVGAELTEGNVPRLADLALAGEMQELADELARLPHSAEGIPVIRALQRRLGMLAPARARIERGDRPDAVMASLGKSLFWKDKALVEKLLRLWDAKGLATVAERAGRLERDLMLSPVPDEEALGEELLSIARAARGRR
jgi:DNA polymerase-3 subunit delta